MFFLMRVYFSDIAAAPCTVLTMQPVRYSTYLIFFFKKLKKKPDIVVPKATV